MTTVDPPLDGTHVGDAPPSAGKTATRRLLAERLARWVAAAGGVAVIASILGILGFLVVEVLPLLTTAQVVPARHGVLPGPPAPAALVDEHRTDLVTLGPDGVVRALTLAGGEVVRERDVAGEVGAPAPLASVAVDSAGGVLAAGTRDGRVLSVPVSFDVDFDGTRRVVTPKLGAPEAVALDPAGRPLTSLAVQGGDGLCFAAQVEGGPLVLLQRERKQNLFTGEVTWSDERRELAAPAPVRQLALDPDRSNLYAVTADGRLLHWHLAGAGADAPQMLSAGTSAVTAIDLLIGGRSLVAGRADGSVDVWAQVQSDEGIVLRRLRGFPGLGGAVVGIAASDRDRTFLVQDAEDHLGLFYSTSGRVLWTGGAPLPGAGSLVYAPKGDAVLDLAAGAWSELAVSNPHPESAWSSFFGKVWYEGYPRPEYVWQSSGGSSSFEPKLSLTPLLFGTLKATIYSLALAIPLAVLAAVYTAQFMHPRLARVVKPTIEIMASLPSVVLGFLAGLWLAPRLEGSFPALLLMALGLPPLMVLAGLAWHAIPLRLRGGWKDGTEVAWYLVALALGGWACIEASPLVESALFGGDFPAWLRTTFGVPYEQRNAIVVGVAMGFAVIPIIFAIAEDAISNVPRDLIAGSLALGADRWETVMRVVLPTASPGIFSAVMVGFGRAIGETMIVLMATGNTPIMDWNAFNGFRTLSANIAVEIPEAPVGSTLYRTLFVAAILLFAVTFLVNTVAELVRQRLRNRYARL